MYVTLRLGSQAQLYRTLVIWILHFKAVINISLAERTRSVAKPASICAGRM